MKRPDVLGSGWEVDMIEAVDTAFRVAVGGFMATAWVVGGLAAIRLWLEEREERKGVRR